MSPKKQTQIISSVEKKALERSSFSKTRYEPDEKADCIVVENFPSLGKLAAVRFIEWVQNNPGGVISLPTGKTPEYFIKWVKYFLDGWKKPDVIKDIEQAGLDPSKKPEMSNLHFVQIDEFYPIDSSQENSFYYYVNKFYIEGFGLDRKKALLIDASKLGLEQGQKLTDVWPDNEVDLSLRYRHARTHLEQRQKQMLERVDQWCMEYEQKIRQLGSIGFFLGGIGPDGHIGFNISGSDHFSTTRLCPVNYETQAAAAGDMGGIETARKRLVITIGLKTITDNPDCTAIVIASGEAKAGIVKKAVEGKTGIDIPASALRKLKNARFYLTDGAASLLGKRQLNLLSRKNELSDNQVEKLIVDYSIKLGKQVLDISSDEAKGDDYTSLIFKKENTNFDKVKQKVHDSLVGKIQKGINTLENTTFLHTEPHHDDVMLGYFAHVVRHFRKASNTHHFMTLTSGFTSVSNDFMLSQINNVRNFILTSQFSELIEEGYFNPLNQVCRNRDVWQYLDGVASNAQELKDEGCARRMLRNLFELYDESFGLNMQARLDELADYFRKQYPGKRDPSHIQRLKGMCREWEAQCLWGYYGWKCDNVHHLRLGFYKGTIFTEEPTMEYDVPPIVEKLNAVKPDIVTVAFDPESSGPDTHYKVLQAMSEAVRIYETEHKIKDLKIWGYRNVWYRFDPSDVNIFVPVSLSMFSVMHEAFMNAFLSQKDASFPSYEYDGPFSQLAQEIQVQQYNKLKVCLGREWFHNHSSPLIRAARGVVFLKEMSSEKFHDSCRELRHKLEKRA